MSANKPICDLYILSAVTDLSFISQTVQHQVKQCKVNGSRILRIDTAKVNGYYKKNRDINSLNELIDIANKKIKCICWIALAKGKLKDASIK